MAEDNQIIPLAPTKFKPRSDEEFAELKPIKPRQEKSSKCLVYFLILLLILSAASLVLAEIFFRPRTPELGLNSVSVKNLVYANKNQSSSPFNMTLEAEFTIDNSNFGQFEFENATVSVFYRSKTVGEEIVDEGRVGASGTEKIKVKVKIRVSDTGNLSNDGILKLSSHAEFSGRVQLLKIAKKKRTAAIDCSMNVNLKSPAFEVRDLACT